MVAWSQPFQLKPAGSPGRSNWPGSPSSCQTSDLHPHLAAGARWKGRNGLGATPKIASARGAGRRGRPARPRAAGLVALPLAAATPRRLHAAAGPKSVPKHPARHNAPNLLGGCWRQTEHVGGPTQAGLQSSQLVAKPIWKLRAEAAKHEV